ncbi:hypothetical protein SOVF_157440 [Spinacia oleracea]|nr:hypothetical protein SOVF_157440 [Spinacia oleracea]
MPQKIIPALSLLLGVCSVLLTHHPPTKPLFLLHHPPTKPLLSRCFPFVADAFLRSCCSRALLFFSIFSARPTLQLLFNSQLNTRTNLAIISTPPATTSTRRTTIGKFSPLDRQ